MGLRVPRSILLVENCSLMRVRNYAKGVTERTVCADMPRFEKILERLLFRLDALISAQVQPEIPENPMSNSANRGGVAGNDLRRPSPCAVVRALYRQVVHRTSSRAKLLCPAMSSLWKHSSICGERGTCPLAARLRYEICSLQVCGSS